MHTVVEALLISAYLSGKDIYTCIRPTLLPEAALLPETCLAELVRTSE
jgi:hypothetical protein